MKSVIPTSKAIEELISSMRQLAGPNQAYKDKKNGDEIILPKGITLFHGASFPFDYRDLKPWTYFTTHLNSPFSVLSYKTKKESDPRIYEFVTTRELRLKLLNAKAWTSEARVPHPLDGAPLGVITDADLAKVLEEKFQGIISPYFEEEMRIGLKGYHFLAVVREHTLSVNMLRQYRTYHLHRGLSGQTGIIGKGEFELRQYDYSYLPKELQQLPSANVMGGMSFEVITTDDRLLAYSLFRRCELENVPEAKDIVFGYTLGGVGYANMCYHMLVVFDSRVDQDDPNQTGVFEGVSKISSITSEATIPEEQWIHPRIYHKVLAMAGWAAFNNVSKEEKKGAIDTILLMGISDLDNTIGTNAHDLLIRSCFKRFVSRTLASSPVSPLTITGPAEMMRSTFRADDRFVEERVDNEWAATFVRVHPMLKALSRERPTHDESLAAKQQSKFLDMWMDVDQELRTKIKFDDQLPDGRSNKRAELLTKLREATLAAQTNPSARTIEDWAMHLDMPLLVEAVRKTVTDLASFWAGPKLSYTEYITRALQLLSQRCIRGWLFDEKGRKELMELAAHGLPDDPKTLKDITIDERKKWVELLLSKHYVFLTATGDGQPEISSPALIKMMIDVDIEGKKVMTSKEFSNVFNVDNASALKLAQHLEELTETDKFGVVNMTKIARFLIESIKDPGESAELLAKKPWRFLGAEENASEILFTWVQMLFREFKEANDKFDMALQYVIRFFDPKFSGDQSPICGGKLFQAVMKGLAEPILPYDSSNQEHILATSQMNIIFLLKDITRARPIQLTAEGFYWALKLSTAIRSSTKTPKRLKYLVELQPRKVIQELWDSKLDNGQTLRGIYADVLDSNASTYYEVIDADYQKGTGVRLLVHTEKLYRQFPDSPFYYETTPEKMVSDGDSGYTDVAEKWKAQFPDRWTKPRTLVPYGDEIRYITKISQEDATKKYPNMKDFFSFEGVLDLLVAPGDDADAENPLFDSSLVDYAADLWYKQLGGAEKHRKAYAELLREEEENKKQREEKNKRRNGDEEDEDDDVIREGKRVKTSSCRIMSGGRRRIKK